MTSNQGKMKNQVEDCWRRSSGLIPLDLVQALLPLCVFDPVTDDRAVLPDVVLKALQEKRTTTLFI